MVVALLASNCSASYHGNRWLENCSEHRHNHDLWPRYEVLGPLSLSLTLIIPVTQVFLLPTDHSLSPAPTTEKYSQNCRRWASGAISYRRAPLQEAYPSPSRKFLRSTTLNWDQKKRYQVETVSTSQHNPLYEADVLCIGTQEPPNYTKTRSRSVRKSTHNNLRKHMRDIPYRESDLCNQTI